MAGPHLAGPIPGAPNDNMQLALSFVLRHDGADVAIVGTRNPDHMRRNIELCEDGLTLADSVVNELHARFDRHDADWLQMT